ncbi:hypothetical protein [Streptomyces lomondensis]|nr:hypothetical protein [Streptomyces lomondensis]
MTAHAVLAQALSGISGSVGGELPADIDAVEVTGPQGESWAA